MNDCEAFSSVDNHEETRGTRFLSDAVSSQHIQDAENTNDSKCSLQPTNIHSALTSCLLTKDKTMLPVNR